MSKTPKLRFKEFSGDWESKKLGDIAEVIDGDRGTNYPKENEFYDDEYCLFLNAKNVTKNGFSFDENKFITKNKDSLLKKGKLKQEDIVLTTRGTIGNIAHFSENIKYKNMRINSGMVILRSKLVFSQYLYSYLKSDYFEKQVKRVCFGSAQPQLTVKGINNFNILYPSREEQEKIASFFTLIDDKISLQSEKVEALKDYKKGMMQKIFNRELRFKDDEGRDYPEWEEKKLGDIVETITDYVAAGSFESIRNNVKYFDTKSYAQLVRTVDLKNKFNNQNFVYVDENAFNFLYRVNLNKECTILPNIGANIGESYFIKPELLPHKFNVLAPNSILLHSDKNNNRFIYYLLNSRDFYKQLDCMVGASGQPKFNKTELKQMKFNLPLLEEQDKICETLEMIDKKINKEQEKLDSLNEYKKGLFQQMFV